MTPEVIASSILKTVTKDTRQRVMLLSLILEMQIIRVCLGRSISFYFRPVASRNFPEARQLSLHDSSLPVALSVSVVDLSLMQLPLYQTLSV